MTYPAKSILLGRKRFSIAGISEADPYFSGLCDNYESDFSSIPAGLIHDHYVCIDIGANIGVKALTLAQYAMTGRVIALEAGPSICDVLEHNVRSSDLKNITVMRTAVGDADGTTNFIENSAYGRIHPHGVEIPVKKLSTIYDELHLARLDFVKIDVEGYEYAILKNCHDLINTKGAAVLMEFNAYCLMAFGNVSPLEFIEWLFEHFKYVMRIQRGASGALQRLDKDKVAEFIHLNLIDDGSCTDLLVTNNAARLDPSPRLLRQRLEETGFDLAAVTAERDQIAKERDALSQQIDALSRQIVETTAARDLMAKQVADLAGERDRVVAERDAVSADRANFAAEIATMRASRSWKLTAPLRTVLNGRKSRPL